MAPRSTTKTLKLLCAFIAALPIAWSVIAMFPEWTWVPRVEDPYQEPLQSFAMFIGTLAILHLLFWRYMIRDNANTFRLIDYGWFSGAAISVLLGVSQFRAQSDGRDLTALQLEERDTAGDRDFLLTTLTLRVNEDKQSINRDRVESLARLRQICLTSSGKDLGEYCAFLQRESIVAACVFPYLDDPGASIGPFPEYSNGLFLGFSKVDRASMIYGKSTIPDELRPSFAKDDEVICQGVKQQIAMAFVLEEAFFYDRQSDLPFGKDGFLLETTIDGKLAVTSGGHPAVAFSDVDDVLEKFGRWSESTALPSIGLSQRDPSGIVSDSPATLIAPVWYNRVLSIQRDKQHIANLESKLSDLAPKILPLLGNQRVGAPLRKLAPWWFLLLPAVIALRIIRTTAEIRIALADGQKLLWRVPRTSIQETGAGDAPTQEGNAPSLRAFWGKRPANH
jgi:hypothetical protein